MSELTSRTYKFAQVTLDKVEWLQRHFGGMTATDVLRVAVDELYDRKRSQRRGSLVEQDGLYTLQVGGQTLLQVQAAVLDRLSREEREAMVQREEVDAFTVMTKLILAASAGEDVVWLDHDYLDELSA